LTEIPEHLLNRSRQRRSALGLGGGEGGDAPATPTPAPAAAADAPAAPAATPAPRAAAPAPAPEAPPPPPPPPPYVEASLRRPRVPVWAVPVLAALPLWGFLYAGTMTEPPAGENDPLVMGETLYSEQCAACHGGGGGGGVGPQLSAGEVVATFPNAEAHYAWVVGGSESVGIGNGYGAADRPGGQRIAKGGMPPFGGTLTPEEIVAIVRYEREVIGGGEEWLEAEAFLAAGAEPTAEGAEEGGTGTGSGGTGTNTGTAGATDTDAASTEGGNVGGTAGGSAGQGQSGSGGGGSVDGAGGSGSGDEPGDTSPGEANQTGGGLRP
jgi:mono/diheme cytochrome c family protein